jgi:hypothetical protein
MSFEDFELETVICYNKEKNSLAQLSTFDTTVSNKMDKLCKQFPNTYKLINNIIMDGTVVGKEYEFPKKLVSIRQPSSRKLTDEQKKAAGERLKKTKSKSDTKSNTETK